MPDLKISQLPPASTPLAGTELVPIVQGGVTDQTTVQAILTSAVPSGTANGVLFLNGSKVVTSGSALTFDGTNFVLGTGGTSGGFPFTQRVAASGSPVNAYRITNGSDATFDVTLQTSLVSFGTGIGDLAFLRQGSEQMRLTSTGLGIGTSSPGAKLSVTDASNATQVLLTSAAGTNVQFNTTRNFTVNRNWLLGCDYFTEGSFALIPSTALGGSTFSNPVYLATATGSHYWYSGATNTMRLDSSGNLGLGVTPSAWGSILKPIQLGNAFSYVAGRTDGVRQVWLGSNSYYDGTNWIYGLSSPAAQYYQNDGLHIWNIAPSGTAGNAISFTQAMTLDTSNNLLVGTTSAAAITSFSGSAAGQAIQSAIPVLALVDSDDTTNYVTWLANSGGTGYLYTKGAYPFVFGANATERARIPAAGGMVVGTAALATTATDGFLYVPTCAGTPTGTPTTQTGTAPIVVDTTNNKLYFYSGGQWRDAGP